MLCAPDARVEVVNFAVPPLMVTVFSVVVPSMKVTVPVGVPVNSGVTVAVKVTDWPRLDGLAEETSLVLVVALPTTCFTVFEVLPRNVELPP